MIVVVKAQDLLKAEKASLGRAELYFFVGAHAITLVGEDASVLE